MLRKVMSVIIRGFTNIISQYVTIVYINIYINVKHFRDRLYIFYLIMSLTSLIYFYLPFILFYFNYFIYHYY